jgi:hypothetical protein
MTLGAKRFDFRFQKCLIRSAVGTVADRAIAPLDRPMNKRLLKVRRQFAMTCVAEVVVPLGQHVRCARTMGVMAGHAHLLGHRFMRKGHSCILLLDILMAGKAKLPFRLIQQAGELCGVYGMAGQAAVTGDQGLMSCRYLAAGILMTGKTELIPFRDQKPWRVRSVRIVAGQTVAVGERCVLHNPAAHQIVLIMAGQAKLGAFGNHAERLGSGHRLVAGFAVRRGHRVMGARFQKLGLIGRMGIMTDGAGAVCDRIIAMRGLKRFLVVLVTRQTEIGCRLRQKIVFLGSMGIMTGFTALIRKYLMDRRPGKGFLLVTVKTEFVPHLAEQ